MNAVDGLEVMGRYVAAVGVDGIVADGVQAYALTRCGWICHEYEASWVFVEAPNPSLSSFRITRQA